MKKQELAERVISGAAILGLAFFSLHRISILDLSPGAGAFPRIIIVVLIALSLMLIASTILTHIRNKGPQEERIASVCQELSIGLKIIQEVRPFTVSVFAILFLLSFNRIGFELSGFALVFATMLLIDRGALLRKVCYAMAAPAFLILVFKLGMGLRLPMLLQNIFD